MNPAELLEQFVSGLKQTTPLEFVAVVFGIGSVYYSRKEHILVYPVGLVNTVIYVYLSIKGHLFGEASVNLFYTIMSIYGWILWAGKDRTNKPLVQISYNTSKEWIRDLSLFLIIYLALYFSLGLLKTYFAPGAIPWADSLASAAAFTGMWLMAKKKVESWYWWIATNICSIPLYFVKGYVFTSVFYFVLLIMAFSGLIEWKKRVREQAARI
jgi:nicotinamide mononucleotide transporter